MLSAAIGFLGNSPARASIGMGIAVASAVAQREISPYGYSWLNKLHTMTQWQIAFTFFAALVITGRPFSYNEMQLGLTLVAVNLTMLFGAFKAGIASLEDVKRLGGATSMTQVAPESDCKTHECTSDDKA